MKRHTPAFVAALAALALAGCGKPPPPKPEDIRPVRVQKIDAASAERHIELAGEVRARYETRLAFRVGGKMTERLVEVGSIVRAGQAVARLDPRDLELAVAASRAQVTSAEADRNLAAADLKRYRDLREKNFISQAEFERRQSALDTADARLEAARAQSRQVGNQAGYAVLTADAAGVITAIEAEAGQVLAAGQTVARLARVGAHAGARQTGGRAPGELEVLVAVPGVAARRLRDRRQLRGRAERAAGASLERAPARDLARRRPGHPHLRRARHHRRRRRQRGAGHERARHRHRGQPRYAHTAAGFLAVQPRRHAASLGGGEVRHRAPAAGQDRRAGGRARADRIRPVRGRPGGGGRGATAARRSEGARDRARCRERGGCRQRQGRRQAGGEVSAR
ncbi:MAG: efflux RND transporter periplasmic adaptor subunit [Betaproteobacteria bacterium]|nr:efflux RND transporter periplasmic adaptor subunit [Betaproteobacteria bacterium]